MTAAGRWQVSVISWRPALLLMLILALSPLDTQQLYRARKSAVVDGVEVPAGAVGGNGLASVPFWTTSAQEGELGAVAELYCGASCWRSDGGPSTASQAAPTTLPVSGGAEPRGARLGVTGSPAVSSCTASPPSAPA